MLYISTSVWVLHTPNAGQNLHYKCFSRRKAIKMQKKIVAKFCKKQAFLTLYQNAGPVFFGRNIQQLDETFCFKVALVLAKRRC